MSQSDFSLNQRQVLVALTAPVCHSAQEAMRSPLVARVVEQFLRERARHDSPLLGVAGWRARSAQPGDERDHAAAAERIADVLRLLVDTPCAMVAEMVPTLAPMLSDRELLAEFVERLYDYWRAHERYLVFEARAESSRDRALEGHTPFIRAHEQLREVVLDAYRRIEANIRGYWPRVYRQLPAGANVSLLVESIPWDCPGAPYQVLREVRMVRLALLEPPVVIYTRRNVRRERFALVEDNPLLGVALEPAEWFCMPVRVGPLVMFIFFHAEYLALGASLVNLFELAGHAEARRKPDGILVFGAPAHLVGDQHAVFYQDEDHNLVLGVVGRSEDVDYFGYLEKASLTLHNLVMMRRGRLPFHGALWRFEFKQGGAAGVLVMGDLEAGTAECLEALRVLADEHLRACTVIADDMGSLEVTPEGGVRGCGTEIGAFVRLHDLQQGFAAGQMDRSILMNPHLTHARLVVPVTTFDQVTARHPVDLILYANNYQEVDDHHPVVERFDRAEDALRTFREGAMMAKGTTLSTGLVHRYFANPFGPQFRREAHEQLAQRTFEAAFAAGVFVGQVRTRVGIARYGESGPAVAAQALLDIIRERGSAHVTSAPPSEAAP